jgi:phage gpG-like protein
MAVTIKLSPPVSFILKQSGAFGRALEDLTPLWDEFDETLQEITKEQFETEGHDTWLPLAQSTDDQKSAHGFPLDPLIRTGLLFDSFDPLVYGAQSFTWGTDIEYAEYHQRGTPRMPQRKVIDLRVEDRQKLEQDMVFYVNAASRRTWGRI